MPRRGRGGRARGEGLRRTRGGGAADTPAAPRTNGHHFNGGASCGCAPAEAEEGAAPPPPPPPPPCAAATAAKPRRHAGGARPRPPPPPRRSCRKLTSPPSLWLFWMTRMATTPSRSTAAPSRAAWRREWVAPRLCRCSAPCSLDRAIHDYCRKWAHVRKFLVCSAAHQPSPISLCPLSAHLTREFQRRGRASIPM